MRRWGMVITAAYALILLAVLLPGAALLAQEKFPGWRSFLGELGEGYGEWMLWVLVAIFVSGEALLLFLSVDTSRKRLKPRSHILVSCAVAGILTALLTSAVIWSLGVAMRGDKLFEHFSDNEVTVLVFVVGAGLWLLWGTVFYLYLRNSSESVNRIISWLLKGSVLELLVVVPCHVIVRRRHDCSAPGVTAFGIGTGIAIMLLSFGPGILLLYKKRLDAYSARSPA